MEVAIVFFGVVGAIWLIVWLNGRLSDLRDKAKKYVELKSRLDSLDKYSKELELKRNQLDRRQKQWETKERRDSPDCRAVAVDHNSMVVLADSGESFQGLAGKR